MIFYHEDRCRSASAVTMAVVADDMTMAFVKQRNRISLDAAMGRKDKMRHLLLLLLADNCPF